MRINFYDHAVNGLGLISAYTEEKVSEITPNMIRLEGRSRYYTEKILKQINKHLKQDNKIVHHPQLSKCDIHFFGGGTDVEVEGKVRDYVSNKYPDLKISAQKCDFTNCKDWWVVCVFEGDGVWYAWDLSEYHPKYGVKNYRHRKYTGKPAGPGNPIITEDSWMFDFDDAKYVGKVKIVEDGTEA